MKKLFSLILILLPLASLYSEPWNNSIGIGLRLPGYYSSNSINDDSYNFFDFNSNLIGLDFLYLGYSKKGFSFKNEIELAFGKFNENNNTLVSFLDNNKNINLVDKFSFGYAIPLSEKIDLIPYFFLEANYLYTKRESLSSSIFGSVNEVLKYDSIGGNIGIDITCLYNFSKSYIYASLSFAGGAVFNIYKRNYIYDSYGCKGDKEINNYWLSSVISFKPSIGCAIKL